MMHRDEYRQLLLAGSVTFPATFPQLGRLTVTTEPRPGRASEQLEILSVEENPSPRVTLSRRVLVESVRAVFLPRDASAVQFSDGEWLLEGEVGCGLKQRLASSDGPVYGIVFVPEAVPSVLNVSAGMTAAESSQYYPPLPGDPSHNHYNPWPVNNVMAGVRKRACSSHESEEIFMRSCSSAEPLWEFDPAKSATIASGDLQEITAAVCGESLAGTRIAPPVGRPAAPRLQPQAQPVGAVAVVPFPSDDL